MRNGIKTMLAVVLILSMTGTAMCLPSTFDWRDVNGTNYITSVKDQHDAPNDGGCYIFAAMACIEAAHKIYGDPITDLDLSEQYYMCCESQYSSAAVFGRVKIVGVPTEECFPISDDPSCNPCDGWEATPHKIVGGISVDGTTEAFKQAIYDYGPISAYSRTRHVVCIVGWNDTTSEWVFKNSVGDDYGDDGYGYRSYDTMEHYGDASVVVGILKEWVSPVSVFASSTWDYTGPPESAIDRKYQNIEDEWNSDYEVPCWIQFDLGTQMSVDAVYLAMTSPKYNPSTFDVVASVDNTTWFSIAENITPPYSDMMFECPIDTTIVRYIRLEITDAHSMGSCLEFGVIPTPMCGDVTGDGNVNMGDVMMLSDHVTYGSPSVDTAVADVTGDGNVNMGDLIMLSDHVTYGAPELNCQ